MKPEETLRELERIALVHGGRCLSKEYRGSGVKLKWQCRLGHRWETAPARIKNGHWCPVCAVMRRSDDIKKMQRIAEDQSGRCVSTSYVNNGSPLIWECARGHQWEATPNNVRKGTWCPTCAKKIRKPPYLVTIRDLRELAESRGGKCLSKYYVDINTKLLWECSHGHRWKAVQDSVKRGSWCPTCARDRRRNSIEDARSLAVARGGACLSDAYVDNQSKLLWECKKGHRWKTTFNAVDQGTWCPACAREKAAMEGTIFDRIRALAKERGGVCLSGEYLGYRTKLRWRCAHGHDWETCPATILSGHWCPKCSHIERRDTLENLQAIAHLRGGKCLSQKYVNQNAKLRWECDRGHRWDAVPSSVKLGTWCPICGMKERARMKLTVDYLKAIAEARGGKCLSNRYVNTRVKLNWECAHGHRWKARIGAVQAGRWCPECEKKEGRSPVAPWAVTSALKPKKVQARPPAKASGNIRKHPKYAVEDLVHFAGERGGKCLAESYKDCNVLIPWECALGHRWTMSFNAVRKGCWCPICRQEKKQRERDAMSIKDPVAFAEQQDFQYVGNGRLPQGRADFYVCGAGHFWEVPRIHAGPIIWCPGCGRPGKAMGQGRIIEEKDAAVLVK